MAAELVLYDIPGTTPETKAWSPNTWHTRYILNYKNLPYRTEWIEYPDIEATCKRLNAKPTSPIPIPSSSLANTTSPFRPYTLPVLYDPTTNTVTSDSTAIAAYLDTTYPSTPPVFLPKVGGLYAAWKAAVDAHFTMVMYPLIAPDVVRVLSVQSAVHFRGSYEAQFHVAPAPADSDSHSNAEGWEEVERGLRRVGTWYDAAAAPFIGGRQMGVADIFLASRLVWARTVMGATSERWRRLMVLDGGRWARFMQSFAPYETVV